MTKMCFLISSGTVNLEEQTSRDPRNCSWSGCSEMLRDRVQEWFVRSWSCCYHQPQSQCQALSEEHFVVTQRSGRGVTSLLGSLVRPVMEGLLLCHVDTLADHRELRDPTEPCMVWSCTVPVYTAPPPPLVSGPFFIYCFYQTF